jgi:IclR family acetate operon transcriptional repressor
MRPVRLAFQIVEEIASHQPIGTSELARRLNLSKTTVHRSLMSLRESGWIEPSEETRTSWLLSIRALVVGGRSVESRGSLRRVCVPVMEDLRRSTEETIHLLVHYQNDVVLIERLDGIKPVRVFNPFGGRAPLHRTSSGMAILAHLTLREQNAYFNELRSKTRNRPPTDVKALRDELARIRERGFSVNLGQNLPNVNAVGAAIFDDRHIPIAAITVSAPSERMTRALCVTYGPLVSDAARRISLGMGLRG